MNLHRMLFNNNIHQVWIKSVQPGKGVPYATFKGKICKPKLKGLGLIILQGGPTTWKHARVAHASNAATFVVVTKGLLPAWTAVQTGWLDKQKLYMNILLRFYCHTKFVASVILDCSSSASSSHPKWGGETMCKEERRLCMPAMLLIAEKAGTLTELDLLWWAGKLWMLSWDCLKGFFSYTQSARNERELTLE